MKEINLTQGQVALVDNEDYEWLNQWKWCAVKDRNLFYAVRTNKEKTQLMHRLLIDIPDGYCCDHIDGNGLNNQRNNLRIVTRRQNNQNLHIETSSQYPGVFWNKRKQRWTATIKTNKVATFLGNYRNEIDAFRAYYDAVLEIGEEVLGFNYPNISEEEKEILRLSHPYFLKAVKGINCKNRENEIYYLSAADAQRNGGFSRGAISLCCLGKQKTHHGYEWQFVSKDVAKNNLREVIV